MYGQQRQGLSIFVMLSTPLSVRSTEACGIVAGHTKLLISVVC